MTIHKSEVRCEDLPPPSALYRAVQHEHAVDLIASGTLYLSNAQAYREDMTVERGDRTETDGKFIRQGVLCSTGHINPVFLWCTSMISDPSVLLETWRDCDTVIRIHDPQQLAERMLKAAADQSVRGLSFHAGSTTYDKCRGSDAPYDWSESIFQKPGCYSHQKEYRFALVADPCMTKEEYVILKLGPCKDLVSIVADESQAVKRREDDTLAKAEEKGR